MFQAPFLSKQDSMEYVLTERRVYGPSHMKFSSDEEKRQAEIKSLYAMTAETEKMRAKNKIEAEKKARAKREKLNALRRRKGLPGTS